MSTPYLNNADFPRNAAFEYGDLGLIPADVWLWQTGDVWMATRHVEIKTWWEGADPDDVAAAPDTWAVGIEMDPRRVRPGTLSYERLNETSEANYRRLLAAVDSTPEAERLRRADLLVDQAKFLTTSIDLDHFAWREPKGDRLLVPHSNPRVYEDPVNQKFASEIEARDHLVQNDLVDDAVADQWVLVHFVGTVVT